MRIARAVLFACLAFAAAILLLGAIGAIGPLELAVIVLPIAVATFVTTLRRGAHNA